MRLHTAIRQDGCWVRTWEDAVQWRRLKAEYGTVAVTNGCFDLLTPGHVQLLNRAASSTDYLIVLLNSDDSIRLLKGPDRPIIPLEQRIVTLLSLRAVDAVLPFDTRTCADEIRALAPDRYIKSSEYRGRQDPDEAAAIAAVGAEIVWIEPVASLHTSDIVARIRGPRANPLAAALPGRVRPKSDPEWGIV